MSSTVLKSFVLCLVYFQCVATEELDLTCSNSQEDQCKYSSESFGMKILLNRNNFIISFSLFDYREKCVRYPLETQCSWILNRRSCSQVTKAQWEKNQNGYSVSEWDEKYEFKYIFLVI